MTIQERLAQLETRLARLEDEAAIRQLMAEYQQLSDDSYTQQWAEAWNDTGGTDGRPGVRRQSEYFCSSGPWWEGLGLSRHTFNSRRRVQGDEAFSEFGAERLQWMPRMVHHLTNEHIAVTGAKAVGHWYSWEAATVLVDDEYVPVWIAGRFRVEFVKERSQWRIGKIRFEELFSTRADKGSWTSEPHVNYGPGNLRTAQK